MTVDGISTSSASEHLYHSIGVISDWLQIDLTTNVQVSKVVFYNRRDCCQSRAIGVILQLIDSNGLVTTNRTLDDSLVQTFMFLSTYVCDDTLDGGAWALVRRVQQGSTWHPATDDQYGVQAYGTYGSASSAQTFSVLYSGLGSEFLFTHGKFGNAH